jgi:type II secretory pathway component PulF
MPEFSYVARAAGGNRVTGTVETPDRLAAVRKIEELSYIPIRVEEVASRGKKAPSSPAKASPKPAAPKPVPSAAPPPPSTGDPGRLGQNDLMLFSEQLAYLLNTGMNLEQALGILAKRLKRPRLQATVAGIHQLLTEGKRFSEALKQYPRSFSSIYVNLAAAGEASGALPEILTKLVSHLKQMRQLISGVQTALIYPSVLFCAGIALVVIFITYMVPQINSFFSSTGGKLPWPTQLLINANDFIVRFGWVGLVLLAAVVLGIQTAIRQPAGLLAWHRFLLRLPIYGPLVTCQFCAQFARTMGTLLSQGVTLLNALRLVEEISGNELIRQRLVATRQAVVDGSSLSAAAQANDLFPELFSDMLSIGERSGHLAKTLENIGEYYEGELKKQVDLITMVLPMAILLLIAVVVGFIVFGVLVAIFDLTSGLRQNIR